MTGGKVRNRCVYRVNKAHVLFKMNDFRAWPGLRETRDLIPDTRIRRTVIYQYDGLIFGKRAGQSFEQARDLLGGVVNRDYDRGWALRHLTLPPLEKIVWNVLSSTQRHSKAEATPKIMCQPKIATAEKGEDVQTRAP